MIGPALYLYIKSLYHDNKGLVKKNLVHFIPWILYELFIAIPGFIYISIKKITVPYFDFIEKNDFLLILDIPYLIIYIVFSLILLKKYRITLKQNFANLSDKDFKWIRILLIGLLLVALVDISTTIIETTLWEFGWDSGYLTVFLMIFLMVFLGYKGISQARILLPSFLLENEVFQVQEKPSPTQQPKLLEGSEKLQRLLLQQLQEEKIYLDEELTLGKLAEKISTTDKKLSTLLNQHMNTTFYDIINQYRIEAVKEKLVSDEFQHMSLLGIAFECGFNSKTSFYRIFKKDTGLSPSEYKRLNS